MLIDENLVRYVFFGYNSSCFTMDNNRLANKFLAECFSVQTENEKKKNKKFK